MTPFTIDWKSSSTHILFNPRMPTSEVRDIEQRLLAVRKLESHLWMATSGSTAQVAGQLKWVALSKQAILASAKAVNQHLRATASDVWIHALPEFHVGGIGIFARATLAGAKVIDGLTTASETEGRRWSAREFYRASSKNRGTLSALVPTQLYDLVQARLQAPPHLRAIVVGGGALSEKLYHEAMKLGWPLLPSYGLTECCSQVATASLESLSEPTHFPELEILAHVDADTNEEGKLRIRSSSLLTGFAVLSSDGDRWIDPKSEDWFQSEDIGEVAEKSGKRLLKILGRTSDFVKIGGESVDLNRLSGILTALRAEAKTPVDLVIFPIPDERLGSVIHGVAGAPKNSPEALIAQAIFERFNSRVLPFERARAIHFVERIPRSPLQKLLKAELLASLAKR